MSKSEETRNQILEKAFHLIYQNGYQATSVDKIVKEIKETKGAFYYHFKTKKALGLAVITEVVYPRLLQNLINPLLKEQPTTKVIYDTFSNFLLVTSDFQIKYGCPTNNLVQEMAPLQESFNLALKKILDKWQKTLAQVLQQGQKTGQIKAELDTQEIATFIVVSYEGLRSIGKVYQTKAFYETYLKQLKAYLATLEAG